MKTAASIQRTQYHPNHNLRLLKAIHQEDPGGCFAAILCGADPNVQHPTTGWSAISNAAQIGNASIIEVLIKAGAKINQCGADGVTPLLRAAKRGNYFCIKRLIDAGADVNATNIAGITPAMRALHFGHAACLQTLIAAGAKVPSLNYAIRIVSTDNFTSNSKQAAAFMTWADISNVDHESIIKFLGHLETKSALIICAMSHARQTLHLARRHKPPLITG